MAANGREYGADYGYGNRQFGRDRGWEGQRSFGPYDAPLRGPGPVMRGGGPGYGDQFAHRYGADFQRGAYDRGYKSRWQTDYGDPYGDRIRQTPMRMVRDDSSRYYGFSRYGADFGRHPYPMGGSRTYQTRGYDNGPFGISRRPVPYEQTGWSWPL